MATVLDGRETASADGRIMAGQPGTGALAMVLIVIGFVLVWLIAILIAARLMMLPPEATGRLYVVFPPDTAADEAYRAIVSAGGRPIGSALGSWSWEAAGEAAGFVGQLTGRGAVVAFRTSPLGIPLAGCLGVPKTPEQRPGFTPGL